MAATAIKIGASVAVLGGVATGSYFIKDYYNTERINHSITKYGKTLLTSADTDAEWAKRWKEYIADGKDLWKLQDYQTAKDNQNIAPKSFKDKCLGSLNLAVESNETFAHQVENWCTKSFKISDLFADEKGIALLADNDDEGLWKTAWNKYFEENKNTQNPLVIKDWTTAGVRKKDHVSADYKNRCKETSQKEVRSKRENDFHTVKSWCTKKTS